MTRLAVRRHAVRGGRIFKRTQSGASLQVFGQDYNPQAYAICGSDMMIKGHSMENIRFGNSFTEDLWSGKNLNYMLANPPFWRGMET